MKLKLFILIYFMVAIVIGTMIFSCKSYPQKTVAVNTTSANKSYFLFLSDVHLYVSQNSIHKKNDTDATLWANCKKKLDSIIGSQNPPSFVLYTGDLTAHDTCHNCDSMSWHLTKGTQHYDWHSENIKKMLADLRQLVSVNKIPLFYVPGNNDGIAGDNFSFADENKQTAFSLVDESVNLFPALNVSSNKDSMAHTVSMNNINMGYFSATAIKGLRVIGLNSMIFSDKYYAIDGVSQIQAGNAEIKWLGEQLKDAYDKKEKVYLAMHTPPGIDAYAYSLDSINNQKQTFTMWRKDQPWLNDFLRLNERYKNTIAGIFYGHTHLDELRFLYDSTGNNISEVAISSPGIAPDHGNNPAFKTVEFDPVNKKIMDFTTYYSSKSASVWGNATYRFADIFNCGSKVSVLDCLKTKPISETNKGIDSIYTAMHGKPSYNAAIGIVVKWAK